MDLLERYLNAVRFIGVFFAPVISLIEIWRPEC
jgi:hypothetical protein